MKTQANKLIKKRVIPFDEVIRLYLKNKPIAEVTKKINLFALKRFCKINQLPFSEDILLRWLYGYTRCQKTEGK